MDGAHAASKGDTRVRRTRLSDRDGCCIVGTSDRGHDQLDSEADRPQQGADVVASIGEAVAGNAVLVMANKDIAESPLSRTTRRR